MIREYLRPFEAKLAFITWVLALFGLILALFVLALTLLGCPDGISV